MRFIENRLYIEFREMVESGVSESYLKKAKSDGVKCWTFINDPEDKRRVLIDFEDLKDVYKNQVREKYGDPYEMVARMPILELVEQDAEAHRYYLSYTYGTQLRLTKDKIDKYTREASWLNMLKGVAGDLKFIKKTLGLNVPQFYIHVGALIAIEKANGKSEQYSGMRQVNGDFPTSYQRLLGKVKKYSDGGYESLIDPLFGNKNSAKIGLGEAGFDPEQYKDQMAVIKKVASLHVGLDAQQIADLVNKAFLQKKWPTLSRSTIQNIMEQHTEYLTPGRKGKRAHSSKMSMQVKRARPTTPTEYWTLDGWTAELLYQESAKSGESGRASYHNRLDVVVVLDAMNNYPVGYAIGERESAELIRQACRNAIVHMQELFGDYYYPYQVQSDNFQGKTLSPFFQAMGHLHTPAAVGNAKAKVVEPYFKYLNKTYCQLQPNWSGHNLDSTNRNQPNREYLNMIKKQFPERAGVEAQIHAMMQAERSKKLAEYMDSWTVMDEGRRQVLGREQWLMIFGRVVGKPNKLTGAGVVKTIGSVDYVYDSFEPGFRDNRHLAWTLRVDPQDMRYALAVSPDGKMSFVLEEKMDVPMALRDQNDEHKAYRKKIDGFNKSREQEIIEGYADDSERAARVLGDMPLLGTLDKDAEAMMKGMFVVDGQQKHLLQEAKGLGGERSAESGERRPERSAGSGERSDWQKEQDEYLEGKIDMDGWD